MAESLRQQGVSEIVIVIYCDVKDEEAATLIATVFGYELAFIPTEEANPETQHTDEDIIAVGGSHPNLFYRKYFCGGEISPDWAWDSILNPANFPENPELWRYSPGFSFGVSPDCRRHDWTITRENGTLVTGVAGIHKEDTLEAARRLVLPRVPLEVAVLPEAVGLTFTVGYGIARGLRK